MGYVIAVAGKGGTGKTTIAALLIRILKAEKKGSILAIDADPNNNLAEFCGIQIKESIGSIIDEVARNPGLIPVGMPKDRFIEYRIQDAIAETDGFDILTMGRPEGPGCYCYANTILRGIIAKIAKSYDYIIIDNEAGLEHLSRRTMRSCDSLVIVSDPSTAGIRTANRIYTLVNELDIKVKMCFLVINRSNTNIKPVSMKDLKWEYLGNIPEDKEILSLSINNGSLLKLSKDAISLKALYKMGDKIWH